MIQCVLFSPEEFRTREDARIAAVTAYQAKHGDGWTDELRALSKSFFPPGSMWFCHWYFDPKNPTRGDEVDETDPQDLEALIASRIKAIEDNPDNHYFLSIHYWRDHARKRPPICVVCPDGSHWIPDSKSSNGSGWTVTGEAPVLVCTPSIWTSMGNASRYHGWLGCNGAEPGWFSNPV